MTPRIRGLLAAVLLLAGCAHAPPPAPVPAAAPAKPAPPAYQVMRLPAMTLVYAKVKNPAALRRLLGQLLSEGRAAGWWLTGPPLVVVPKAGPRAIAVQVRAPVAVSPPFARRQVGATRAAVMVVHGTLAEVEMRARRLAGTLTDQGRAPTGPILLFLVDDPGATAPAQRRTRIVIPIQ